MLKQKVIGFLRLIRFGVSAFACIGLFVSGILAGDLIGFQVEYLLAFFIIFISAAGAFAINDYFDYEVDVTNNRTERPLVAGSLSRKEALIIAILSFILVVILGLFLNLILMILVYISLPLFYLYSMGLKKIVFFKNFLIAYSYLATILLGSLVTDAYLEPIIIYFGMMGFIVGLANEIMFDIADVKGDNKLNITTLSTRLGIKKAAQISVILYIIIMVLDPLPFIINIDSRLYFDLLFLTLILIPVTSYILLSLSLIKNQSKENVLKLRVRVFLIMQLGTLAYLFGVLF